MLGRLQGVAIVGVADTPKSAIEGILRSRPHYVILDLPLRGGYGIEVLRTIHEVEPGIIFIVLTNHPQPQYRKIFTAAGAKYFLDKHTEFGKVREIIAELAPAN